MKHVYVDKDHFERAFNCLFTGRHLAFLNDDNHLSFFYYSKKKDDLVEIHCTCKNVIYSCDFINRKNLVKFDCDEESTIMSLCSRDCVR